MAKKISLKKILLPFTLICFAPIFLSSCGKNIPTGNIVWANYESYMSSDIVSDHNEISWIYYGSDDEIMNKFTSNYDIATPTCLTVINMIKQGLLQQVQWDVFELVYFDEDSGELKPITSGIQVEEYLIANNNNGDGGNDVNKVISEINKYLVKNKDTIFINEANYLKSHGDQDISILDWCVPYFLQTYAFSYWNDTLQNTDPEEYDWKYITDFIANAKTDKNYNKFSIPDEGRTFFGYSKLLQNEADQKSHDLNPDEKTVSENDFIKVFNNFTDKVGKNKLYLNSDSVELASYYIGDLENKKGQGIISYSGDLFYASIGLGQKSDEKRLVEKWFDADLDEYDLMRGGAPKETAMIMDGVVFNKTLDDNSKRMQQAYDIVNSICLDNVDSLQKIDAYYANSQINDDIPQTIIATDENDDYIYESFSNFDYVLYVSPWAAIDEYVMKESDYYDGTNYIDELLWWLIYDQGNKSIGSVKEDEIGEVYGELADNILNKYKEKDGDDFNAEDYIDYVPQGWKDYLKQIYALKYPDISDGVYYEVPISSLQRSNLHWAYEKIKSNL